VAQPFDAERLKLAGEAVPIAENVGVAFSVSATGVLALRNTGDFATTDLVVRPSWHRDWARRGTRDVEPGQAAGSLC
jgi:hypothetical protein